MCYLLCLFSALSYKVDPLDISVIIMIIIIIVVDDEKH